MLINSIMVCASYIISTDLDLTTMRSPHNLSSGFFSYETDTRALSELPYFELKSEGTRSFCVTPRSFMSLIEAVIKIALADGRDLKIDCTLCNCKSKIHGCSFSVSNSKICRPCRTKCMSIIS